MELPKRSLSHQIETKSINQVRALLEPDYLVRFQDERDYGIDLHIERCNNSKLTGDVFYAQVKGTEEEFGDKVVLSGFSVQTLNYACLFSVPFFLFYTSVTSAQTKFVWLQKYVDFHLKRYHRNFQEQKTVTIEFPRENDLQSNKERIVEIVREEKLIKNAHAFMMPYRRLLYSYGSIRNSPVDSAKVCIHSIVKIVDSGALSSFTIFDNTFFKFDVKEAVKQFQLIIDQNAFTDKNKEIIDGLLGPLKFVELALFNADHVEIAGQFLTGQVPY